MPLLVAGYFVLLRRRCTVEQVDGLLRAAEALADRVDAGASIGDSTRVVGGSSSATSTLAESVMRVSSAFPDPDLSTN